MADTTAADLDQLEHDLVELLTAAGFPHADENVSGFSLTRDTRSIHVGWCLFEAMLIGLDTDHPMARFELDVVNATLKAFADILAMAGYTVTLSLPDNDEDRDLQLKVIAGPSRSG
ncbi:hypothetical protein ACTMTI_56280 [Nonomuraea sp. H19]|uniref:hypothetical protein n=1 Tax=Nonomuraea sp. H19 TaxID=3452206 RepID=UPI003F8BC080